MIGEDKKSLGCSNFSRSSQVLKYKAYQTSWLLEALSSLRRLKYDVVSRDMNIVFEYSSRSFHVLPDAMHNNMIIINDDCQWVI